MFEHAVKLYLPLTLYLCVHWNMTIAQYYIRKRLLNIISAEVSTLEMILDRTTPLVRLRLVEVFLYMENRAFSSIIRFLFKSG